MPRITIEFDDASPNKPVATSVAASQTVSAVNAENDGGAAPVDPELLETAPGAPAFNRIDAFSGQVFDLLEPFSGDVINAGEPPAYLFELLEPLRRLSLTEAINVDLAPARLNSIDGGAAPTEDI